MSAPGHLHRSRYLHGKAIKCLHTHSGFIIASMQSLSISLFACFLSLPSSSCREMNWQWDWLGLISHSVNPWGVIKAAGHNLSHSQCDLVIRQRGSRHLCYTLCLSVCRWIGAAEMEALKMFYLYGIISFCCSVYGGVVKKKSQKAKCRSCMMMMMCACTWILLSHQSQGSCKSGWISLLLSGYLLIAQHSSSNDVALYQLTLYTQLSRISCYLLSLMQWVPTLSSCPTRQCMSSFPFFNFGFWCCTSIYLSSCGSNINLPAKTDFLKIYLFSTLFSCKLNNAETLWDLKETKQVAQSEFQIFFLQFFRKKLSP